VSADDLLLRVKALARRAGLELQRYNPINALDAQRALLIERERIDLVLDGGANRGQWARDVRAAGFAGPLVSFEPLAAAYAALAAAAARDPRWDAVQVALDERAGEAEIHVAGNEVSSSLLEMEPLHERAAPASGYVGTERIRVARLDELELPAGRRALLKLDVQGAELRALRGAAGLLDRIALIEAELSFAPLYAGGPLAPELLAELDRRGFALAGISSTVLDETSGRMLQADALFARRAG
jgi:FkbM family methyltransferase